MQQMILTALIFAGNESQNRPIRPKGEDSATTPASHRHPRQLFTIAAYTEPLGIGRSRATQLLEGWKSPEGLSPDFQLACTPVRCRKTRDHQPSELRRSGGGH